MARVLVSFGDSWPWGSELDSLLSPDKFAALNTESQQQLESLEVDLSGDHYQAAEQVRCAFAYPYLVAEAIGCDSILDLSGRGGSLSHLFLELCNFKKVLDQHPENQYIFLVSLTTMYRDLYFDVANGEPREIMPYADTAWYYRHIDTEHTGVFNWVQAVSSLQLFCKQHQIPDFYFQEFTELTDFQERLSEYQSMIDWQRVYDRGNSSFMTWFQDLVTDKTLTRANPTDFYTTNLKKYFYPCVNHPNIQGHQVISEHVVNFIQQLNPELIRP